MLLFSASMLLKILTVSLSCYFFETKFSSAATKPKLVLVLVLSFGFGFGFGIFFLPVLVLVLVGKSVLRQH
jgi:hypothetical protein